MTPKEKAQELVNKFFRNDFLHHDINYQQAKECALIAVDEILLALRDVFVVELDDTDIDEKQIYYQEVKQEIEKL